MARAPPPPLEHTFYAKAYLIITTTDWTVNVMLRGVDISEFNIIDYNNLKSDFAIIRAGYGKYEYQKDKKFETHYSNLHDKMPIGAYWYSYAMSEDDARAEAKICISVLKGKKYELPIYYDVEEASMYNLGRAKVSNIIRAFCKELEAAGYWVGVYCSSSWYNAVLDDDVRKNYAIWVAEWNTNKPNIGGTYGAWQYKVGSCVGAQGQIDLDYIYVDYPTQIKNAGKNGYTKPVKTDNTTNTEPKVNTKSITLTIDGITYKGELKQI